MRTLLFIAALSLSFAFSTALPAAADPQDDVAAITTEWVVAFSEHNIDRTLALYSKDALLWGTTSPQLRTNPAAVRAFFESAFKIPNLRVKLDNQTIRLFGDSTAVTAGNYTFTASQGDRTQNSAARYSFTLIKDGGKWLIVDHNSSLLPGK